MSEAKFTPGPWTIDPMSDDEHTAIIGGDNKHLCTIEHEQFDATVAANVQVMLVAPDLYAALQASTVILRRRLKEFLRFDIVPLETSQQIAANEAVLGKVVDDEAI